MYMNLIYKILMKYLIGIPY